MPRNRAVIYKEPGVVAVEEVPYPTFVVDRGDWKGRKCNHGAIVRPVATNICGSDEHMVRGRAGAPSGIQLGHEITAEIVEVGPDVEFLKAGDWVSVPFNVCCGRCRNCIDGVFNCCLNVNKKLPGGAYGYVLQGDWPGGQAEYMLVPYADFNCLKLPDIAAVKDKFLDVALLSDILPTGYHGCMQSRVTTGSSVYIAGAGPVGLCAAACCLQILGASTVIVSDFNLSRLKQAERMGCETIHLTETPPNTGITGKIRQLFLGGGETLGDHIQKILGTKSVDCAIDAAGFETNGLHGNHRHSMGERAEVVNDCLNVVKYGGGVGVLGVYLPVDTGADDAAGKAGALTLDFGASWSKHFHMETGQCPTARYNKKLLDAILSDRLHVAEYLNMTIVNLDEAPKAYKMFSEGAPRKFVIDPHGLIPTRAKVNAKALTLDSEIPAWT